MVMDEIENYVIATLFLSDDNRLEPVFREALSGDLEDIFYKNVNYDVIFGKNRKC